MQSAVYRIGYGGALVAFAANTLYCIAQVLQVVGLLGPPFDAPILYATSLGIEVPFLLAMLALFYAAPAEKKIWAHAALLFSVMYALYVTLNYTVQLATVIPATFAGTLGEVRLLDQTPHSLFWDVDALGYIFLGLATLFAVPVFANTGVERWVRRFFLANGLVTPLITFVYFYPGWSLDRLYLATPWVVTSLGSMLMLLLFFRQYAKETRVAAVGALQH